MLQPTDGTPAARAPRFATSIIPSPPGDDPEAGFAHEGGGFGAHRVERVGLGHSCRAEEGNARTQVAQLFESLDELTEYPEDAPGLLPASKEAPFLQLVHRGLQETLVLGLLRIGWRRQNRLRRGHLIIVA